MVKHFLRRWRTGAGAGHGGLAGDAARRRTVRLWLEELDGRCVPANLTITLDPTADELGNQIQTVTQFGNSNRTTLGIFDTGASPITVSVDDQETFADASDNADPIPVKVVDGAFANGIGGDVVGDVGQPVTVLTDGLHAATFDFDLDTFEFSLTASFDATSARVSHVQTFIGTEDGSPDLPTISGTPVFFGSFNSRKSETPLAAKVDLVNGVDFLGFGITDPDLHFVPNTATITPGPTEFKATMPLAPFGDVNVTNPGNDITAYYNYVSDTVGLKNGSFSVGNQRFLFDTGAQLTVISMAEAEALHVDLAHPFDTLEIGGVGGSQEVNCYVIDSLTIGLTGGDTLTFEHVPAFVLDAAPGLLDGILGMNLWNIVDQMLINPFTPGPGGTSPTVSITWDPNGYGDDPGFGPGGGLPFKKDGPTTMGGLLGGAAGYFRVPDLSRLTDGTATPPTDDVLFATAGGAELGPVMTLATTAGDMSATLTAGPAAAPRPAAVLWLSPLRSAAPAPDWPAGDSSGPARDGGTGASLDVATLTPLLGAVSSTTAASSGSAIAEANAAGSDWGAWLNDAIDPSQALWAEV